MRTDECRVNIDKAADACDLDNETVRQVKAVVVFCEGHPGLEDCSTAAIQAVMRMSSRDKIAAVIKEATETGLDPITKAPREGIKKTRYTAKEVERIASFVDHKLSAHRKKVARDEKKPEKEPEEQTEAVEITLDTKDPEPEPEPEPRKKNPKRLSIEDEIRAFIEFIEDEHKAKIFVVYRGWLLGNHEIDEMIKAYVSKAEGISAAVNG